MAYEYSNIFGHYYSLPYCKPLVVKYNVERPSGELGVSKSRNVILFPFSALTLYILIYSSLLTYSPFCAPTLLVG